MHFLIIVHGYDENHPNCSCDLVLNLGCVINEPTPPGYKCECERYSFYCNGRAQKCKSEEEYGCNGCKEKECCTGDCGGYLIPDRLF